jgi:hypothetical protein
MTITTELRKMLAIVEGHRAAAVAEGDARAVGAYDVAVAGFRAEIAKHEGAGR